MEIKTKVVATAALAPTDDPYTFSARVTTGCLDRQAEIVIPDGIDLSKFMQSGFWTWEHDYSLVPVAFPDKSKKVVRTHDYLELSGRFMERPADHVGEYWPDTIRDYVSQFTKAGIQPGVSIGFKPTETRKPTKLDRNVCYQNCLAKGMSEEDARNAAASLDAVISKCELLEVSFAIIPANPEAVITSVGKGLISKSIAAFAGVTVPEGMKVEVAPVATPDKPVEVEKKAVVEVPVAQKTIHMLVVLPTKSSMDEADVALEIRKQMAKSWGRNYLPD